MPAEAGTHVTVKHRIAIRSAMQGDATMIAIGLHDNCDALVATAVLPRGGLAAAEPAVQEFLNSRTFADWAVSTTRAP